MVNNIVVVSTDFYNEWLVNEYWPLWYYVVEGWQNAEGWCGMLFLILKVTIYSLFMTGKVFIPMPVHFSMLLNSSPHTMTYQVYPLYNICFTCTLSHHYSCWNGLVDNDIMECVKGKIDVENWSNTNGDTSEEEEEQEQEGKKESTSGFFSFFQNLTGNKVFYYYD